MARTVPRDALESVLIGADALMREGLERILGEANFRVVLSADQIDEATLRAVPRDGAVLLVVDGGADFYSARTQVDFFRKRFPRARVVVLGHNHQLSRMLAAVKAGANAYFARDLTGDLFVKILKLVMVGETVVLALTSSLFGNGDNGLDGDNSGGQQLSIKDERQRIEGNHHHDHPHHEKDNDLHSCDPRYKRVGNGIGNGTGNGIGSHANAFSKGGNGELCLSARQLVILKWLSEGDSNKVIARKTAISEATVKVHVKAILRKLHVNNRVQAAVWALNHNGRTVPEMGNGSCPEDGLSSAVAVIESPSPALRASLSGIRSLSGD